MNDELVPGFAEAYAAQQVRYPMTEPGWQPVHTVYVPADRFSGSTVREWGGRASALAEAHLGGFAPDVRDR
ncbi:MAG: aldolase, partial [Nonomuraea sp.]|nr:aldolase [Nonomuraea sp.]